MKTTIKSPKVIGIILTYKHASFLENLYRSLPKGIFDSIIISDDESGDKIGVIAKKLDIPCFSHSRLGYGGNIKYGLQKALEMGGEYMVEIHGDGQYGTLGIIPGIQKMKKGYDFILGSRFTDLSLPLKDKMPLLKYLANIGLSFLDRLILRLPLSEFHTGFRIYSRRLLTKADLRHTSNDHLFSFQIIALAAYHNLKVGEIPVRGDYAHEHSSISIRESVKYTFQTFGVLAQYLWTRLGFETELFKRRKHSI